MLISYLGKLNTTLSYCMELMQTFSLELQRNYNLLCSFDFIDKKSFLLFISDIEKKNKLWISCCKAYNNSCAHPLSAGLNSYDFMLAAQAQIQIKLLIKKTIAKYLNCFSPAELKQIKNLNPLLWSLKERYEDLGVKLNDTILIFRDHCLVEKLNIISALLELGLLPSLCWIIPKRDRSLYNKEVCKEYLRLGCKVYKLKGNDYNSIIRSLTMYVGNKDIIVVDDGGDLIMHILDNYKNLSSKCTFIETTSKGIALLKRFSNVPIINLAHCAIKNHLSLNIATSCVIRLRDIVRHESFIGENCLVVGYGKLGSHIATLLKALGVNITIIENNNERRSYATMQGYDCFSNIMDAIVLKEYKYILGCSGASSVPKEVLEFLPNNSILATCSSQDLKLLIQYLKVVAKKIPHEGIGDVYYLKEMHKAPSKKITVIAHGNAVNLYYYEGVPEPEYDYFTSLVFAQIVTINQEKHEIINVLEFLNNSFQKSLVKNIIIEEPSLLYNEIR